MAELAQVLRALQSTDNAVRSAAEAQYEAAKKDQPQATVAALFSVLTTAGIELPVREQAAVLLRQCLGKINKDANSVWARLGGDAAHADVKAKLLQLLEAETDEKVRRKVADVVQSLGCQLIKIEDEARPANAAEWPEVMPTLMRMIMDPSKAPGLRGDCLWAVKEMSTFIWQCLVASTSQTTQVLQTCLADPAEVVRANASCLLCEFISNIEKKEERKPFAPLIPVMLEGVKALASGGDVKLLKDVLQSMATCEETADFYRDCVGSHILPTFVPVCKSHPDNDVRRLALEVLVALVEGKPKMMLKVPNAIEAILEICVTFLMELDDDVQGWTASDDDEDTEGEDQHDFGMEALDRVAGSMQKNDCFEQVMATLQPAIAKLFQQAEWKPLVAGLILLKQIVEYVEEEAMVTQMLTAVKAQLRSAHPRVRHAAWSCVLQFAEDHSETVVADAWSSQLLPEFLVGLDDPCPRVCLHSMIAFQSYGENVERENIDSFVPDMMGKLGQKLQGNNMHIKKETITFIAVIAGQIEDGMAQYYAPLMPVLKTIISASIHKAEERALLGKSFECISLLANAVGKDTFRADAEVIMQAMIQATQVPDLPKDDPVLEYMMAAAERICSTMKEDFLPFVPHLLPLILTKFALTPTEYHGGLDGLNDADVSLALVPTDDGEAKVMVMNSSEMEDLKHAIECVHTFVEKLGQKFAPFISQTAQALLPVFEFSMSEEIRDQAFETWGQLCNCSKESGQGQVLTELVNEFMKRILPKLELPCVDIQAWKTRTDGVMACLKEAGPNVLGAEQVKHISMLTIKLISDSIIRREEDAAKKNQSNPNEDDDAEDDDDEENEEGLRNAAVNCASAIMTHHPDLFVAHGLEPYLQMVQKFMQPGAQTEDRRLGHCVVFAFGEHLKEKAVPHWPSFLPAVLQDLTSEKAEVRTPACYATSFLVREAAFAPYAADTAATLAQVITQTRARGKKKSEKPAQMAADNALSALVELLMHHSGPLAAAQQQLWTTWLSALPVQEDEAEGVRNHKILLRLMQAQKPEVVGPEGSNLPRLLSIVVDIYKTDMVDELTSTEIGKLLVNAGEAALEKFAAAFSEKQKKKLMRIVRETQAGKA